MRRAFGRRQTDASPPPWPTHCHRSESGFVKITTRFRVHSSNKKNNNNSVTRANPIGQRRDAVPPSVARPAPDQVNKLRGAARHPPEINGSVIPHQRGSRAPRTGRTGGMQSRHTHLHVHAKRGKKATHGAHFKTSAKHMIILTRWNAVKKVGPLRATRSYALPHVR